jgi:hypothetical protein
VVRVRIRSGADINNIRTRITADTYSEIVDAFLDGFRLSATGRIERDGRYYWMVTATDLEVVEPPDGADAGSSGLGQSSGDNLDLVSARTKMTRTSTCYRGQVPAPPAGSGAARRPRRRGAVRPRLDRQRGYSAASDLLSVSSQGKLLLCVHGDP